MVELKSTKKEDSLQSKKVKKDRNPSDAERVVVLTETLQRLQAEFENYRKRVEKQQQEFTNFANKQLLIELLPLLDHFTLALQNTSNVEEFVKGIELIFGQFSDFIKHHGIEQIPAEGLFNPECHEALLQEESEKPEGTVLEVLQQGYRQHGIVLRPTKVKIAKGDKK